MEKLRCLRCGEQMKFIMTDSIPSQTSMIAVGIPNIFAETIKVHIYSCPNCRKLEFFQEAVVDDNDKIAQMNCPKCGALHDIDYPKCPLCKFNYNEK